MSKNLKKILLISASLLMIASVNSSISNLSSNNHTYAAHKTINRKSYLNNAGRRDAYSDYKEFQKIEKKYGEEYDQNGSLLQLVSKHYSLMHNHTYQSSYINKLNSLLKRNKIDYNIFDKGIVKFLLNNYRMFYHMTPSQKKGYIDSYNNTFSNKYAHNIGYGKAWIKASADQDNSYDSGILNGFSQYQSENGAVPYYKLLNHKMIKLYKLYKSINKVAVHKALTDQQVYYRIKSVAKHFHMNKRQLSQYKYLVTNDDEPNFAFSSKSFGTNVYKHYPFHEKIYQPKFEASRTSGDFNGLIIGIYNTKASHQTAREYHKYMNNLYKNEYKKELNYDESPVKNKYMTWWHAHYVDKNIKGNNKYGSNYADWHLIYNRNKRNSSIYRIVPNEYPGYIVVRN